MNLVALPRGIAPCAQRVPEAPPARAETAAENRQILPDGLADMRTQFLNFFIILVVINIVLRFNLVRVEIRELRPEVVAESDEVLVHYRSRTNV